MSTPDVYPASVTPWTARKAVMADAPAICDLINAAARDGGVLPRPLAEVYENLRQFHVLDDGVGVAGCVALHIDTAELAEVRSLVVRPGARGHGGGRRLLEACLDEARILGIARVYALTRSVAFFRGFGFTEFDKHELPSKVFRDCVRCPSFPDCDEVAMIHDIPAGDGPPQGV